jgi:CheY-like chemotaxis protein
MKRILVVEDNTILRANIVDVLTLEGFEVLEAENGKEGVQKAISHLPDLLLCDIHLPQMDGQEVVEHLRANPATARIPFIIMTADPNIAAIKARLGIDDKSLIRKPFQIADLLAQIQNHLT